MILLLLLWSLVEVHSQTVPYVSFMGESLPNHSYVDLSLVGEDTGNPGSTVRCITDLGSCCTGAQGRHRGDWYFPDRIRQGFTFYQIRQDQRVDLRRRTDNYLPSGIYRCDIPTVAVHDEDDVSVRDTVYVGLYATEGIIVCTIILILWLSHSIKYRPGSILL